MNENVKTECVCNLGYDKGVLKKTIENNVFTIYGNINKNNYIILRYHGELIDKINYQDYNNNLYISYYFDNNNNLKKEIALSKCTKCVGENYCVLIPLEEHNTISFEFYLQNEINLDTNLLVEPKTFNLEIKKEPLTDLLQKYGLEENTKLPVAKQKTEIQIKKIIDSIKDFFISLVRTKRPHSSSEAN